MFKVPCTGGATHSKSSLHTTAFKRGSSIRFHCSLPPTGPAIAYRAPRPSRLRSGKPFIHTCLLSSVDDNRPHTQWCAELLGQEHYESRSTIGSSCRGVVLWMLRTAPCGGVNSITKGV